MVSETHRSRIRSLRRRFFATAICVAMAGIALGCTSTIPGVPAIASTANPSDEIASLGSDVQAAREAQLDVLAPTWFGRAEKSFAKAEKGLESGDSVQAILRNVAEGRAELAQATTFAEVSRQTLPSVIQARQDAITAGAENLGGQFDRVENRFVELTRAVETDSLNWARRNAPDVEKQFRSVELASIKRNTVERIADLLEKAKEADAARYAPDALADVERRYASLDKFISQNRYASEAMGERASEVLFYANRLVYLTEDARRLSRLSPTQLAMENEAVLAEFAQKLELPDLRNQSTSSQRRQIENAIGSLLATRHDLQARVDRLRVEFESQQGRLAALKGEAEQERIRLAALEAERRFNQRFAEVSEIFSAGEAEVYKKGSQLVIRVRSMQFPVGTAVIGPADYPVLAKVQKAIQSFDQPRVIVEGHTDSTGSAEVNDRLSQERADAVLAYLVNNKTIAPSRISAVGKAFSEPLASDRTAAGRAQNRRIDVIIDAAASQSLVQNMAAAAGR